MLKTLEIQTLKDELMNTSCVDDIEAGAHHAPINNLSDPQFELLLWSIFDQREAAPRYFDKATLMINGADKGRDVWLTKDGNPAGLVQCKRLKTAFSAPSAVREVIKFILFAELEPDLIHNALQFKYSLAVSSDPTSTTVGFFTSPTRWLEKNDDHILGYVNEVIGKYRSFKDLSGVEMLNHVKSQLNSFSYELIRPADINVFLNELPRVRERFFRIRLVHSEENIDDFFGRITEKHGIGRQLSDKARLLLDSEVETQIDKLRRSRFFPGSEVKMAALKMCKQLETGELSQASDQVRSNAFGACGRWLSRTEEKTVASDVIAASESLGTSEDAVIAKAFLLGNADWAEGLNALGPLESPAKVMAAFQTVNIGCGSDQALKWLENAGLEADEFDADGKAVLMICMLDSQDWDAAYTQAISLNENEFAAAPILYHLAGIARLLKVVPEDLKEAVYRNIPFARNQFPLADDPKSLAERKATASMFRKAEETAAEFRLDVQHIYGIFAYWLELHDPNDHEDALRRLTLSLNEQEKAIHYIPLGMSFGLTIDQSKVERVLKRQEALCPRGNFEIGFARFIMANSIDDPVRALEYFDLHRDLIQKYVTPEYVLEFEVRACVLAGRVEPAKELLEKSSKTIGATGKARIGDIISQGRGGPGVDDLEAAFVESPTTANLENLVNGLGQQGFSDRFFELARKLVVDTRSRAKTEHVVRFLFANGRHEEIKVILSDASTLIQTSHELRGAKAWVQFRNGDFDMALKAVVQLREERSEQNDRYLHQNLLIASGRWEELAAFVEEEWQYREERTPDELHALAQLSGAIGSPRLKDFLKVAAKSGEDSPGILLGCYMTAVESGIDEGSEVFNWLERAAHLSDEDGPVQSMSIDEIAKAQPDWNEHVDTIWESFRKGEMPLSMLAAQLRRSSLEMQVSSIVLNHKQVDPRRRGVVSAFSGVHGAVTVDLKIIGLESTALVTLASLNLLDEVIQQYDEIQIPHSTLGWLFRERRKLAFHQPSRIKAARALLNALTSRKVHEYSASMAPDAELATLVDVELAEMLTSARADNSETQTLVVRSAPVHRIGSLMDETVDLSDFKTCLGSCQTVIDKLANLGLLMQEDEKQARAFLSRSEQRWPDEPEIEDGAQLFLDDLSVSYFQTTNLLNILTDAGLRARSRWILQLLDIRNWAGSFTEHDGSGLAQYGMGITCNNLALRHLDIQDGGAAERYSQWLEEEVFDNLRTSDPTIYDWLIKSLKQSLLSRLDTDGEHDV